MSRFAAVLALLVFSYGAFAATGVLEERFIINAQYRNGINKAFKDLGSCTAKFRTDPGGFALQIAGTMKNPENGELYRMKVTGEFKLAGRAITKVSQKVEMNDAARRYEKLMTENLPFVWLARFQTLPPGPDPEDVTYTYNGHDYRVRYVPLDGLVEGTVFQGQSQIGKFFIDGKSGQPPKSLTKARLIGPDHLVFSLVLDTRAP